MTDVCAPVSGKLVLLWLNVDGCHAVVVWHVVQSVANPADACGGFVAPLKSVWWHPTHAVGNVVKLLFTWHDAHGTEAWAPVRGNDVVEWSKDAGCHAVVVWHVVQSVGNPVCGGLFVALKSAW